MRCVSVKSEEQQASGMTFRARDLLVRQRTQLINALQGHLAEFGEVVAQGPSHVSKLVAYVEAADSPLPETARQALSSLVTILGFLADEIDRLDRRSPGAHGKTRRRSA